MKKIIMVLAFLLIPSLALAAPFIVCDPQEGVVGYEIKGLSPETINFVAQPDGSLKYDAAQLANGSYSMTIAACNMWGCGSATSPFVFAKGVPGIPVGVRLSAK